MATRWPPAECPATGRRSGSPPKERALREAPAPARGAAGGCPGAGGAPGGAAEGGGVAVGPRDGRAGLANYLVYRYRGTERVVGHHGGHTPGRGAAGDEAELPGRPQRPEAAVDVEEDGRAFSRRVEVHVLGEGWAEWHVEVVDEVLARLPALALAERLVEGGGLWEEGPQVVLGVEILPGCEGGARHGYRPPHT